MNKTQAQTSVKKVYSEAFSLSPSALLTMFEVDARNLAFDLGLISDIENDISYIFRFHNNIKLGGSALYWNSNEYIAAPIEAEGFEISARGTLPRPLLRLTTSEEGISLLGSFKLQLKNLEELVGAKVTRIRTLAKYIDERNFQNILKPAGWAADPNAEFSRDVFFIERKSNENKSSIELELSSILDLENINLPRRTVYSNTCSWVYRGCGCNYEFYGRGSDEHGSAYLLQDAPPVANSRNEKVLDILGVSFLVDKGAYAPGILYNKGDYVYLIKDNIKYYFVSKYETSHQVAPPNGSYWIVDACSKTLAGCRLRYSTQNFGLGIGVLPYGGFPSVNKLS